MAVTAVWAVVVYAVDVVVGANYGYLVRKPPSGVPARPMGPWPVYLLVSLGVLVGGMGPDHVAVGGASRHLRREPAAPPGGPL